MPRVSMNCLNRFRSPSATPSTKPEQIADTLDEAGGLPAQLERDPGVVIVDAVECHNPAVLDIALRSPRNPFVRVLLHDFGVPFPFLAGDLWLPVKMSVVKLLHLLDALHKLRELLELGPLVVDGAQRSVNVNCFGCISHISRVPAR
jgi:hypothetical protein